ncbi:hypothetical protein KOR42_31940 [Thalassoglobus neptunius]|uniref:Uncharacterized protein n=1 Tax=Thalassoglobus neptunius TaxID=1938619 RepID=A0A5C5WNC6_9PLAN|nr:hypothetical protein KOR42_31940 [Thalassoglobus neptunius]
MNAPGLAIRTIGKTGKGSVRFAVDRERQLINVILRCQ